MEAVQALLAAETADSIVGFLYRVHSQDRSGSSEQSFETNGNFNNYVDELCGPITIFDVALKPSEILFQIEPESYRIYLAEYDGGNAEASELVDEGA